MKIRSNLIFGLLVLALFYACNPECENYSRISAEISPKIRLPGEQILVTTNPPEFLLDKELYVNKLIDGELVINDETIVPSTPSVRGRIVTLPKDIQGAVKMYIKDNDCGGFIPLTDESVNVVDQDFINRNQSLFISPTPPNIIIPTISIIPPGPLVNRWFSPTSSNYSIWFNPLFVKQPKGGGDSCRVEQLILKAGVNGGRPGDGGSWEVSQCGSGLGHSNPVSGVMDKKTGFVSITIDRTSKGLGFEHFEGFLTTPDALSPAERIIPPSPCDGKGGATVATKMLVLTSKETGRQLILLRNHEQINIPQGTYCD